MTLRLRRASAQDVPAMIRADGRALGVHYSEQDVADFGLIYDPDRFLLACEADGRIVGVTGDVSFRMTVPGGAQLDVLGVTWVSVAVTHRRRGVLRRMLAAQHERFVDAGAAVSVLTASEGGIYGRFGYGPATVARQVDIDRARATFRPGAPDPGGVWQAESDEARQHAPEVHERWRVRTPGALSRSAARWDRLFLERGASREGGSALFFLLHADGYASYRIRRDGDTTRCLVVDLLAATDGAHAALWRVLLGLDLVDIVSTAQCPR